LGGIFCDHGCHGAAVIVMSLADSAPARPDACGFSRQAVQQGSSSGPLSQDQARGIIRGCAALLTTTGRSDLVLHISESAHAHL
jgi:hypothetical protein